MLTRSQGVDFKLLQESSKLVGEWVEESGIIPLTVNRGVWVVDPPGMRRGENVKVPRSREGDPQPKGQLNPEVQKQRGEAPLSQVCARTLQSREARTAVSRIWFRAQLLHSLALCFSVCKMDTMSSHLTELQGWGSESAEHLDWHEALRGSWSTVLLEMNKQKSSRQVSNHQTRYLIYSCPFYN